MNSKLDKILSSCILAIPLVYLLLLHLLGSHATYTIHDNLDSEVLFRTVLKDAGLLFSTSNSAIVPTVMADLPRNAFNASAYNLISVLFGFLSPLAAYQWNEVIQRCVALFGTWLLCTRILLPTVFPGRRTLCALIASAFAVQDAFMLYGMTALGIPLLLYAWIQAQRIPSKGNVAIAVLATLAYAFDSSIVLFGYAVILQAFAVALWLFWNQRKRDAALILSLTALLGCAYLISEMNLIKLFLFSHGFVSHRMGFNPFAAYNYRRLAVLPMFFLRSFFQGDFHSPYFAIPAIALGVTAMIASARSRMDENKVRLLRFLLILGLLYAFIYMFLYSYAYAVLKTEISVLRAFAFERFYFGYPTLWTLVLGVSTSLIVAKVKRPLRILLPVLLFNLAYGLVDNTEIRANVEHTFSPSSYQPQQIFHPYLMDGSPWVRSHAGVLGAISRSYPIASWEQFYAESLFAKIDSAHPEIKRNGWIVTVGFYPAIAQFNGFRTLDSYQNNYALSYKLSFRKIIAGELALSPQYRDYFDCWGGRCDIFSHEISARGHYEIPLRGLYLPDSNLQLKDLQISTEALRNMGGTHLLSSMEILNASSIGLHFVAQYQDSHTPLHVYLYEVEDKPRGQTSF